jgi:hypothetical protein
MPAYAGYRFITISPRVVAPPVPYERLRLDAPLAEGSVSGTLLVRWTAMTPICRGEDEAGIVAPFRLGTDYALPGASLRGMVRSVFEITTFSHLGPINEHHRFGYRDFSRAEWRARTQDIKGGWLSYDRSTGAWRITPTAEPVRLIPFDALCGAGTPLPAVSPGDWLGMSLAEKRRHLATIRLGGQSLLAVQNFERQGPTSGNFERVAFRNHGAVIRGSLVCAGEAEIVDDKGVDRTKRHEAVFGVALDARARAIPKSIMETFVRLNSNPGRDQPEPIGNWRYWLIETGLLQPQDDDPQPTETRQSRIPVFYVGNLDSLQTDTPDPDFAFGLSRVIKIPYRHSVGEIAARLYGSTGGQYRVPRLRECFDFSRAVFGAVDDTFAGAPAEGTEALRGRVAFGFATSHDAHPEDAARLAVLLGPRASYFPFYLKGPSGGLGSYDDDGSLLAGRKRYPVRRRPHDLSAGAAAVTSHVRFLKPGCNFEGQVRFHNLHPVELGALLWALTLGKSDGSRWHSLGRARGFGYGALSPAVSFPAPPHLVNGAPATIEVYIAEFTSYMTRELGENFEGTLPIRELVHMADPAWGERNELALTFANLDSYVAYKRAGTTLPGDFR